MNIIKHENGIKINDSIHSFTNELLENSYLVHNDFQISIEVNEKIILIDIRDTDFNSVEEFINEIIL